MLRVATDVGGTFTDLVYFEIDEKSGKALSIKTAKSDTTPSSYEKGVFDAIEKGNVDIAKSTFFVLFFLSVFLAHSSLTFVDFVGSQGFLRDPNGSHFGSLRGQIWV